MTACPHEPARAGVLIRTWEVRSLIKELVTGVAKKMRIG
jgi:hypothetical protein